MVGWLGVLVVLGAYATGSAEAFAWSNTLLWPAVIAPSVARGAWSAAAISFTFGVLGTLAVIR